MPDIAANKAALRRVLKAYERGELGPLLALIDDSVVWTSNANTNHYRFGGRRWGRAGVIEALSMIAADYQITRYEVVEMVGEGDVIWVTSDVACHDKRTGKPLSFSLINRWEFGGGRIVSCSEFFDTAGVLHQQGRLPDPLPIALRA